MPFKDPIPEETAPCQQEKGTSWLRKGGMWRASVLPLQQTGAYLHEGGNHRQEDSAAAGSDLRKEDKKNKAEGKTN